MNLYTYLFYFFEVCAGLAAVGIIFSKNVFYATLLLLGCLLSLAGIYVLAFAEFVAVTQILIYAGGVLVLILFGIMLTAKLGTHPLHVSHANEFSGAIVGLGFIGLMAYAISGDFSTSTASVLKAPPPLESLGASLMTTYLLPFEIAGILLLIALVGAAVVASHKSDSHATH
jgi:NADH-quinone oxidoreductase subunit J